MDHNEIQNIVLDYVNSLSKDELERYNHDPKYDGEDAGAFGLTEYSLEQKYDRCKKVLSITRSAVCANQGQLVQFMFLAAEKHKALRVLMQAPQRRDAGLIKEKILELRDYIDFHLKKNIDRNIEYIYQYFDGRCDIKPRICIKGKSVVDKKHQIIRIFSDKSLQYNSNVDIDKSSAYKYIKDNGRYYLQNDIPGSVKRNTYENSRLDIDKINHYMSIDADLNSVWSNCWKNSPIDERNGLSFYKSTLIIPVTLLNNALDKEFVYEFNSKIDKEVGESVINPNEIERTIFAFLCIDHVEKWYFDEEDDVRIGYMIADLISFYLFLRVMYIEISDVFANACQYLNECGVDITINKHVYAPVDEDLSAECVTGEDEYSKTNNNLIASISGLIAD
jgi:hypothetical protein